MTLTTKQIKALKPLTRRYSISDGNGLTIRVQPSGKKSWVFRFHHSGRVVDETIGKWPEMSLKQARQVTRNRRKEAGLTPPRGYVLNDAFRLWCGLKKGGMNKKWLIWGLQTNHPFLHHSVDNKSAP